MNARRLLWMSGFVVIASVVFAAVAITLAPAACAMRCAEGRCIKIESQCMVYKDTTAWDTAYALTGGGTMKTTKYPTSYQFARACMKECSDKDVSRAHTIPPPPDSDGNTCSEPYGTKYDVTIRYCGSGSGG